MPRLNVASKKTFVSNKSHTPTYGFNTNVLRHLQSVHFTINHFKDCLIYTDTWFNLDRIIHLILDGTDDVRLVSTCFSTIFFSL